MLAAYMQRLPFRQQHAANGSRDKTPLEELFSIVRLQPVIVVLPDEPLVVLPNPGVHRLPDIRGIFDARAEKKLGPFQLCLERATNLGIEAVHNHQLGGVAARKVSGFELSDIFRPLQADIRVRPSVFLPHHKDVFVILLHFFSLCLVALLSAPKEKARFRLLAPGAKAELQGGLPLVEARANLLHPHTLRAKKVHGNAVIHSKRQRHLVDIKCNPRP